jgi:hypothetical protein
MSNQLIGITGMMCILIGFLLNQVQKWKHDSIEYDTVNLVGSVLLTIYSINLESMPFIILNVVWAAVSLKDIYKFVKLKK